MFSKTTALLNVPRKFSFVTNRQAGAAESSDANKNTWGPRLADDICNNTILPYIMIFYGLSKI